MGPILDLGDVLVPVLLCVLIGFGLAKLKKPFDIKMVSSLVSNVGYPALILSHLEGEPVEFADFVGMMIGAISVIACFAVIGFAFLKTLGLSPRVFQSPMMFNNVGNIGIPVSALAFGDLGLAYALAFFVVVIVGLFTIGVWLPMGKANVRDLARQPVIYAILIALVLMATDMRLPTMIDQTFAILGGLAIPLMLLTLGHTLATLRLGSLWRGCYLALFHIAMAASVALVLVHLFGFEGTARGIFILLCMMPVSVACYLWAEIYTPDQAPDVAAFILISTLLAVIVLPLVLTLWV